MVRLVSGETVRAGQVLLATGAYLNMSGLVRDFTDSDLDLTLTSQTVAFVRISPSEAAVSSVVLCLALHARL